MSFDQVRQRVESVFFAEFLGKFPGTPIMSENQPFNKPTSGSWAAIDFQPNVSKLVSLGPTRRFRHEGLITVHLMQAANTGTAHLHDMAETTFAILADRTLPLTGTGGQLRTYGARRTNRGDLNGFYTETIQIMYRHDQILDRNY